MDNDRIAFEADRIGEPAIPSTDRIGRHLLSDNASIDPAGRLSIAGVDLLELVADHGTPLFVYDEEHLRSRCREAVAACGPGVAYASKAFLCKAMAALAVEEGMRLDVATAGELVTALAAGVPGNLLVLHGNNKSSDELIQALDVGVGRIVIDSFDEIERLRAILMERPLLAERRQQVLLRVTPGVEAHTHEYVMTGQEDSKFGFSIASGAADRAAALVVDIGALELVGLHAHIGSQIFRLEGYERAVNAIAPILERFGLLELCVGGGLGVAYLNHERAPTITEWAQFLHGACERAGLPSSIQLTMEPGRAIVASAGLTCYQVGTIKALPGIRTYVAVDGGMSDNPRPILYGSGYEAFLPRAADAGRRLAARVVGKHCESGDVLVVDARLPADLAVGDVLATPVTGAYGFSMASNYNRLPRPAVIFVRDGSSRVVVRRERFEDMLRLEP